jgi:uncharacterized damage-inducible protein DinB
MKRPKAGTNPVAEAVAKALSCKSCHVSVSRALEGLDWKLAGIRPKGSEHTISQFLAHMTYWQDWAIEWLEGKDPGLPKHASLGWQKKLGPKSAREWKTAVGDFERGLRRLTVLSGKGDILEKGGKWTRLETFRVIVQHNSYHIGQIVLTRTVLGAWPPPSGGDTW